MAGTTVARMKFYLGATFLSLAAGLLAAEPGAPVKRVAFVLDDGPVKATAQAFLDLFAKEGVHVNFSYEGGFVKQFPDLAKAAVEAGHEINNHSYTHPHLKTLSDAAVLKEVADTNAAILEATGKPAAWFWAPFLELDARVEGIVRSTGIEPYPFQNYNFVSSDDWNEKVTNADALQKNATTGIVDGTVILFHEWRADTLARMPAIIAELRRQGCVFMTFTELAQSTGARPVLR